jgi:polyhydroxyalkanoate synthesis regulator phasin
MLDSIFDAAKIGLGAVWLSKDNLKKLTDALIEVGKVSKEEGDRLFKELADTGEEQRKKIKEIVESSVKKAMEQAGLATKAEVDELKKKVEELESKLTGSQGSA